MSRLSSEEKSFLLRLARQTLESRLCGEALPAAAQDRLKIPPATQAPAGAFVSLHKQGELRGCVGMVEPRLPLYRAVMEAALSAAFADPRFPALRASELAILEIEISVLSPSRPIAPEQIQIGVHGLIVTQGKARGLLLPQVAVEHSWGAAQFLEETCRKAGLARDAWRMGAKLEAFEAEVFGENSSPAESLPG